MGHEPKRTRPRNPGLPVRVHPAVTSIGYAFTFDQSTACGSRPRPGGADTAGG